VDGAFEREIGGDSVIHREDSEQWLETGSDAT